MAIAMRGLKAKPSYEQLIGVATSGGLENIKFPNRDSTFQEMVLSYHNLMGRA